MTTISSEQPKRMPISAFVDESQRRFLGENAKRNDRSLSAELRRAIDHYQRNERTENHV